MRATDGRRASVYSTSADSRSSDDCSAATSAIASSIASFVPDPTE
jgi:hypothetical protein